MLILNGFTWCVIMQSMFLLYYPSTHFSVPQILCCGHHHLINGIVIKGVCVKVYMTRYL